jgi:16S rRNA (guanine1516-N2)-methyltransferase
VDTIAVGYVTHEDCAKAHILAKRLGLTLDNHSFPQLCVDHDELVLLMQHFSPLRVDFSSKTLQKRRDEGKKQGLVRACKPSSGLKILDATAGWGRDAGVLASYGARVHMFERNPIMASLLADALEHAEEKLKQVLSLSTMDTKLYLQELSERDYPDIVYIDPMHPVRQKSALVKKDMQALQTLLGTDEDALALLSMAITKVKQRVVVKWPQKLPPLLPPDLSLPGKTVRFDVYLAKGPHYRD